MFVELGSGPDEWDDPAGARAVAGAVLDIEGVSPDCTEGDTTRHVVGFGGGHYAPRFERIIRETDWAVGHIGADWQLSAMGPVDENRDVVRAAFGQSAATLAVVDGDHPDLHAAVSDAGFRVVSETFLQVTTGVPRALVDRVEDALGPVDDGLRFGEHARRLDERPHGVDTTSRDADDDNDASAEDASDGATATLPFEVVTLPDDLLAEALGADAETARAAVADNTVGYQTQENGRRPAGQAALPAGDTGHTDAYDRLVAGLCDALRDRYREVTREERVVVARERAFDPEAAATLGVTEGPAFGRLANGESVEVDGREIPPDAVHTERTIRFTV
jgi:D-aminoacyl-tRNA deacylase